MVNWAQKDTGRETGENPQVPAWRGGHPTTEGINMQVWKGTMFA